MMQKYVAETLGTAMLLIGVVGSGIMGETLAGGNIGLALTMNAVATGAMLYVIITILGPISGAHFNPIVTGYFWLRGEISARDGLIYVILQIIGGIIGVWFTHAIFDQSIFQASSTGRASSGQWVSEIGATFGLLMVIVGGLRARPDTVPALVGLYICGAYFFTASTSFANPAVTIARMLSDTFAGIYPGHAPMFILCQGVGMGIAAWGLPRLFTKAT